MPQFRLIRDATRAFNLPCIEQSGFEADDIIATYATQAAALGGRVTIVSADKDLMQLVAPGIEMFDTLKNKPIGPDEVFEKFGVGPDRVIDVQALAGDSVDNVPGAPGIGVKTAAQLISEYGDLDTLLERAGEIRQPKRREVLLGHAEQIRISRDARHARARRAARGAARRARGARPRPGRAAAVARRDGVPRPRRPGGDGARGRRRR